MPLKKAPVALTNEQWLSHIRELCDKSDEAIRCAEHRIVKARLGRRHKRPSSGPFPPIKLS